MTTFKNAAFTLAITTLALLGSNDCLGQKRPNLSGCRGAPL